MCRYKGVDDTLKTRRVDVLKINSEELLALCEGKSEDDLDWAAEKCFRMHLHPGSSLAITRGSDPALMYRWEGDVLEKWSFEVCFPGGTMQGVHVRMMFPSRHSEEMSFSDGTMNKVPVLTMFPLLHNIEVSFSHHEVAKV